MLSGVGLPNTLSKPGKPFVFKNKSFRKNPINQNLMVDLLKSKKLEDDGVALLDFATIKYNYWLSFVHKYTSEWGNDVTRACQLYALPIIKLNLVLKNAHWLVILWHDFT